MQCLPHKQLTDKALLFSACDTDDWHRLWHMELGWEANLVSMRGKYWKQLCCRERSRSVPGRWAPVPKEEPSRISPTWHDGFDTGWTKIKMQHPKWERWQKNAGRNGQVEDCTYIHLGIGEVHLSDTLVWQNPLSLTSTVTTDSHAAKDHFMYTKKRGL